VYEGIVNFYKQLYIFLSVPWPFVIACTFIHFTRIFDVKVRGLKLYSFPVYIYFLV